MSEREKKRILTSFHAKREVLCSPLSCCSRPKEVWLSEPTGMQLEHQTKPLPLLEQAWSSFRAQEMKSRRYVFHHSQQYAALSAFRKLVTKASVDLYKAEKCWCLCVSLSPILTCSNPSQQPDFWMRLWKSWSTSSWRGPSTRCSPAVLHGPSQGHRSCALNLQGLTAEVLRVLTMNFSWPARSFVSLCFASFSCGSNFSKWPHSQSSSVLLLWSLHCTTLALYIKIAETSSYSVQKEIFMTSREMINVNITFLPKEDLRKKKKKKPEIMKCDDIKMTERPWMGRSCGLLWFTGDCHHYTAELRFGDCRRSGQSTRTHGPGHGTLPQPAASRKTTAFPWRSNGSHQERRILWRMSYSECYLCWNTKTGLGNIVAKLIWKGWAGFTWRRLAGDSMYIICNLTQSAVTWGHQLSYTHGGIENI